MPHRDDFEAALARIAALEHELDNARGNADEALRVENARLVGRVAELERQLAGPTETKSATTTDADLERRTAELVAKLQALAPDERAQYLVNEAELVATTEPLRAVVKIARRFVEGNATRSDLVAAERDADEILTRAYETYESFQSARSTELVRGAFVVVHVVSAIDPEQADQSLDLLAKALSER